MIFSLQVRSDDRASGVCLVRAMATEAVCRAVVLLVSFAVLGKAGPCVFQPSARAGFESAVTEKVAIQPWGNDSLRVRVTFNGAAPRDDLPSALIEPSGGQSAEQSQACFYKGEDTSELTVGSVISGNLRGDISPDGLVTFTRVDDGFVVLKESNRTVSPAQGEGLDGLIQIEQSFASSSSEMIFGFGEHENGHLNQKGLSYNFADCTDYGKSHGGEVCLPYITGYLSNTNERDVELGVPALNYGFLWNMPGFGTVSFDENATTWMAVAAAQLDYFVTVRSAGSAGMQRNADISAHYIDATGHSPVLPDWAVGYWHSKCRYASQSALIAAAQEFHNRSIPVDIIVIDFFNWAKMGDFTFDPKAWPDPKGMVDTVKSLGMNIMVSVWPFSAVNSTSVATIKGSNYAVDNGTNGPMLWPDPICSGPCYLYDPTNPEARQYVWSQVKKGYFDYGIQVFWLDASEPEHFSGYPPGAHYSMGPAEQVGMVYPFYHSLTFHDGLVSQGDPPIMLLRSAWAGMQRHGGALWSGDTHSDFTVLEHSIRAGLNVQLSGIAWWTTDIGGFTGGHPNDTQFRELIVRWFQYGSTCPLFRQHGNRPTEPWLLGNQSYDIIVDVIQMRHHWKDYVMDAMKQVNATGLPVQRPLWYDFPDDPKTWQVEDQYLFGSQIMAAPVYTYQARNRTVYFPAGTSWTYYFADKTYDGGNSGLEVTIDAPLEQFPLFTRNPNAAWPDHVPIPPYTAVRSKRKA